MESHTYKAVPLPCLVLSCRIILYPGMEILESVNSSQRRVSFRASKSRFLWERRTLSSSRYLGTLAIFINAIFKPFMLDNLPKDIFTSVPVSVSSIVAFALLRVALDPDSGPPSWFAWVPASPITVQLFIICTLKFLDSLLTPLLLRCRPLLLRQLELIFLLSRKPQPLLLQNHYCFKPLYSKDQVYIILKGKPLPLSNFFHTFFFQYSSN